MNESKSFKDVYAWRKAHEFVLEVYKTVKVFPDFERFGLVSQFTRAAVSVPANIAEGYKKISKADKLRFMNIAQGSLEESSYYIILAHDLNYISDEEYNRLEACAFEASRMLHLYIQGIINNNHN